MLAENQRHIRNDAIACESRDYDDKKKCYFCMGYPIDMTACVSCYQYRLRDRDKYGRLQ